MTKEEVFEYGMKLYQPIFEETAKKTEEISLKGDQMLEELFCKILDEGNEQIEARLEADERAKNRREEPINIEESLKATTVTSKYGNDYQPVLDDFNSVEDATGEDDSDDMPLDKLLSNNVETGTTQHHNSYDF